MIGLLSGLLGAQDLLVGLNQLILQLGWRNNAQFAEAAEAIAPGKAEEQMAAFATGWAGCGAGSGLDVEIGIGLRHDRGNIDRMTMGIMQGNALLLVGLAIAEQDDGLIADLDGEIALVAEFRGHGAIEGQIDGFTRCYLHPHHCLAGRHRNMNLTMGNTRDRGRLGRGGGARDFRELDRVRKMILGFSRVYDACDWQVHDRRPHTRLSS